MNIFHATLHNPQSGETLAQISIDEQHIMVDEVISASGNLQSFTILSGNGKLKKAWFNKKAVLLRSGENQQLVKIATYPTNGENQGHFFFLKGTRAQCEEEVKLQPQTKAQSRRWLSLLQTILGI